MLRESVVIARRLHIGGVVQGVGFRPFVFRLAREFHIRGWVYNGERGVEIHAEGDAGALEAFARAIGERPPPAARIASIESTASQVEDFAEFEIRASEKQAGPTVRISPDLPVCDACLRELFDPHDRRFQYPYINCTDCGPRYSIILGLPYDRPNTTMRDWPMCEDCSAEYHDPGNRRFHAQPLACAVCGPNVRLQVAGSVRYRATEAMQQAARLLRDGSIVAVKGLGGYHLACDARNARAVAALRERKYRKERPFAVMARDLEAARECVVLDADAIALLGSIRRPIVLAEARFELAGIAPDNRELGIMLAYTPLQHLLYAFGAPELLVMTSANRSSEPIAYTDTDALDRLDGIADAFVIGEREIARRVDDSVARVAPAGMSVLRHSRGFAPEAVATLPTKHPILAVGADLKNAVTLVVSGEAFSSQHIGDLEHFSAFEAFRATIADMCAMYEVRMEDVLIVHDAHPEYASTLHALTLPGKHVAVQHHRAHVASVLAERAQWDEPVIGVAFDGTGYGDDGSIWGGEIFTGSVRAGFRRAAHLRIAALPGGDAAARFPVQAAAGFLEQIDELPDLTAAPFAFPAARYRGASELARKRVRTFPTSSIGRLFDTVAALLGFTRESTFEGQAAMWVEHLARSSGPVAAYSFPVRNAELDFRPLLAAIVRDRIRGRSVDEIAAAFHAAIADAICQACDTLEPRHVVVSGGVFQNTLLLELLAARIGDRLWTNTVVPANDGGISLGQAAIAALTVS
jgi:hydrogenase maturation protein HypF